MRCGSRLKVAGRRPTTERLKGSSPGRRLPMYPYVALRGLTYRENSHTNHTWHSPSQQSAFFPAPDAPLCGFDSHRPLHFQPALANAGQVSFFPRISQKAGGRWLALAMFSHAVLSRLPGSTPLPTVTRVSFGAAWSAVFSLRQGLTRFLDLGSSRLVGARANCQQFAKILATQIAAPAELRSMRRSIQ